MKRLIDCACWLAALAMLACMFYTPHLYELLK
jgi:hypothetical protein